MLFNIQQSGEFVCQTKDEKGDQVKAKNDKKTENAKRRKSND